MKPTNRNYEKKARKFYSLVYGLIAGALFLMLTLSCGENDDTSLETNLPSGTNLRISQITRTIGESTETFSVGYNSDGRIIEFGNSSMEYDYEGKIIRSGTATYSYDDQGRIVKVPTAAITYNNQNQIASLAQNTYTANYKYNNKNQLETVIYGGPNATPAYTKLTLSYDIADNIIQILKQSSSDGVGYTDEFIENFSYDDKKNPFYNLLQQTGVDSHITPIYISYYTISFSLGLLVYYYGANNLLSYEVKLPSSTTIDYSETNSYEYNDAGYPISIQKVIVEDGSNDTYNYVLTYEEK